VAGATKSTFISITTADIVSKYVGESEKQMQILFDIARENSPAIIFFDEIDSFTSKTTDRDNESKNSIKNQLLTEMDGFTQNKSIFVMATTNHPERLDNALLRRFNKLIYVPLPDLVARQNMFKHLYSSKGFCQKDFETWAEKTNGFSGSDIDRVFVEAQQLPIQRIQRALNFRKKTGSNFSFFF
jgi:vacuolar protein-sorting-associated protein 4